MFSSYFAVTLCVAKHNSVIINPLSQMAQNFTIGPFEFQLHENQVNAYKVYNITYENTSVLFQIICIDTTNECGPRSCFNFVEFIWNYLGLFRFKIYAIVAVPLGDEPTILCLQHHRVANDGWPSDFLCMYCLQEFQQVLGRLSAIVVWNVPADAMCVCVNRRPSEFRHRILFSISR